MKKNTVLILLLTLSVLGAYATRPTVQATFLTQNNKGCISINLRWTNGNGAARIIVGRMGAPPDYVPEDDKPYTGDQRFGKSPKYGNSLDNFIVYNSNGTNFVKIDSLLPCKTYYFRIYEHDNSGNLTKYDTSNVDTDTVNTYCTTLNYTVKYFDSCQIKNKYEFTNTSTSTIPGITYRFYFADGDSSLLNPVIHSYKISGLVPANIRAITPIKGCQDIFYKGVRVYQKKVVFIDFAQGADTVQCLDNNLFKAKTGNFTNPLSGSYGYRWFTDNDTLSFSFFQHSYKTAGRRKVSLEITTNISKGANTYPTSCKDTLSYWVEVLPSPIGSITLNDTQQCITKNLFVFNNPDTKLVTFKWIFGDNDSSLTRSATHKYKDTGTYQVIHEATDTNGCTGIDTGYVRVLPDIDPTFSGLDSHYCSSGKYVILKPNRPGGQFSGYSDLYGDSLVLNQVGTHTIRHIVKDAYCADTSFQKFTIDKNPAPNLGPDVVTCIKKIGVPETDTLDANETGQYLWNTNEVTKRIGVSSTGLYYVDVTQGKCTNRDSVNVIFTTKPKVSLGSDTILCKGGSLRLNASSPDANYVWNTGSRDSFIYAFTPGKYVVTVSNACGIAQDSIYINFQTDYCDLFMANAFTPGNDLINNVFMPRGRNITVKTFQIFNRWGELIFQTDENNVGWDGTYKGEYVQDGLYIWRLFYTTTNGPYIKKNNAFGQVLLIR